MILVSIMVHESNECVVDMIENVNKFLPGSIIVLHVNPAFSGFSIPVYPNVYINPNRFRFNWLDTMIGQQISNFEYIQSLGIPFHTFLVLPSNALFVRSGAHEYLGRFDVGCLNRVWDDAFTGFINHTLMACVRKENPELGELKTISNIDGMFFSVKIFEYIKSKTKHIFPPTVTVTYFQEEFVFPLFIDFVCKQDPTVRRAPNCICKINFVDPCISLKDIDSVRDGKEPDFFCVKRIPRINHHPMRDYIHTFPASSV